MAPKVSRCAKDDSRVPVVLRPASATGLGADQRPGEHVLLRRKAEKPSAYPDAPWTHEAKRGQKTEASPTRAEPAKVGDAAILQAVADEVSRRMDAAREASETGIPGWENERFSWPDQVHFRLKCRDRKALERICTDNSWQDLLRKVRQVPEDSDVVLPLEVPGDSGYDTERAKDLHGFATCPEELRHAHFSPQRDACMVNGRPVVVIVITHETSKACELSPYANNFAWPARPVVLYGPELQYDEHLLGARGGMQRKIGCYGHVMHEALLRYMTDSRHAQDTLFVILEGDYRVFENDARAFEKAELVDMFRRRFGETSAARAEAVYQASTDPSPEIADFAATAAFAQREFLTENCPNGHGNLIWMSWEPNLYPQEKRHFQWTVFPDQRGNHPTMGNYAALYTVAAAARFLWVMDSGLKQSESTEGFKSSRGTAECLWNA